MDHYLVDERDVRFVLEDYLNVGQLAEYEKYQEVGFDWDTAWAMVQTALQVAKDVIAPINEIGDKEGITFEDGKVTVPEAFHPAYKAFIDNGFLVLSGNPEWGGLGWPAVINMQIMEFMCGAGSAFTMFPELAIGAARMFDAFANDELKNKYLPKMFSGEWGGTMCLTEPGAGSDVGALKTIATRNDDGSFNITGTKLFISSGDHDLTENIIHPVLARVEGAPAGIKGISLFLVPKVWVNDDGTLGDGNDVVCGSIEHKMGIKGSATCTLNFGEGGKCIGWLVGKENEGIKYMFMMMNEARLYVGLQAGSLAGTAYMNAVAYAKERVQFRHIKDMAKHDAPGVPIVEHPDVRRMLMHCKAFSEGFRAMLAKTAFYEDLSHVTEGAAKERYHGLVELFVPIAKAYITDWTYHVTEQAIQVYGGYGYCSEYPVEQYARDAKILSLYEGTNGIQALDLLGRKLTINRGMLFMYFMQDLSSFCQKNGKDEGLGDLVKKLQKAQEALAGTVMGMAGYMKKETFNEKIVPVLQARPFLDMFGHILMSHLLLEMAFIAQEKLNALFAEKGVEDDAAKKALIKDNDEAKFLWGKMMSAKWFVNNILPEAFVIADYFKTNDLSALEIEF
ncbi:MAG: acyl-CoA dehydrogenase [Candidatus Lernaella stagnicola]|nr:acyl-CoA dehydrogenase [Candidatus Lernaella stagnicola]